jgi:2-phospho-L-lactate/phosphoenolpyruvate guanylyltransferase
MIVAAVPVKDLANAKQRLVGALAHEQRVELARAMLADVLRAVTGAGLDAVWVVTRDGAAAALARRFGAEPLVENANRGHTAAVAFAQRTALERGVRTLVTVPGDVPCVTAGEVAALAATAVPTPSVVFSPSRSERGTNGVALSPPGAMQLTFGEPSFENHLAFARMRGLVPRVLRLPGLSLDIDDAGDLRALLLHGPATESGRLVAGWRDAGQLAATAAAGR